MRKKILRVILIIIACMVACLLILLLVMMQYMQNSLLAGNEYTGEKIQSLSASAMIDQSGRMLLDSATERAAISDSEFSEFSRDVNTIAKSAADIYENYEEYSATPLEAYDESDIGKLVVMTAYGNEVDPESEEIKEEVSKIANLKGLLKAIRTMRGNISYDYFATETGVYLGCETVSELNIPKEGEYQSFEARERPWYVEARSKKETIFTGIIKDADSGNYGISCGSPVIVDGEIKGVAGAGMFLDSMKKDIESFQIGKKGYALIINDRGQILFSGSEKGELAATDELTDIRGSKNKDLGDLITDSLAGISDLKVIKIDGESHYIACAPMKTVGWAYLVVLPESEVLSPTSNLLASLDESNAEETGVVRRSILSTIVMMLIFALILTIVVVVVSRVLAVKLAGPITKLSEKVKQIEGDNLDFEWDEDTNDEVSLLADSFSSMTERMKQYIKDLTEITAEKERIGAELSVATHIQASMLPSTFPAFPERDEFDLFASMDPAKEVGGDFYDFFFVDRDHLAIVIADVSGKGVPAALFMVIAKTLIKNHAQELEDVDRIFIETNNQLCEGNGEGFFVTAWIGVIDMRTGVMSFCDAGHENPFVLREDGNIEMLRPEKKRIPLAAMEDIQYIRCETTLKNGDLIFLYTDGVPEATNSENELYTTERLESFLRSHYSDDPERLLHGVRKDVDTFVGGAPQFDDLTMLGLRIRQLDNTGK
ncbi:MAG: SpoIIE family protein phosphatase [Lachnospiraceae bacterium]|nr:SpoIIE family protein phosphatase [Lachnospiraceae bacterium]